MAALRAKGLPTPDHMAPGMLDISLAADYQARVYLLGLSFPIHFSPTGSHGGKVAVQ
ncbi:MAG TPA: hypothetical protein VEJ67_15045 [Candidatus Cybelea sp.]|nr:hypothetical protein [Candidatus Cybelea sp.]